MYVSRPVAGEVPIQGLGRRLTKKGKESAKRDRRALRVLCWDGGGQRGVERFAVVFSREI